MKNMKPGEKNMHTAADMSDRPASPDSRQKQRFTLRFDVSTLSRGLSEPWNLFGELPADTGFRLPLLFLIVSSLAMTLCRAVFNGASQMGGNPLADGMICFLNSAGMPVIMSVTTYCVMVTGFGRRASYTRIFNIHALAAGITTLGTWLPSLIIFTIPWNLWLIGTGLTRHVGMKRTQAALVIGISLIVLYLFFRSLLPLIVHK